MKTLKIMMIEDEEADFLLVSRHIRLSGLNAEITWVRDSADLTNAIVEGGWDVVLSDYKMAGLDFMETLDIIIQNLEDIPVIMVSGSVGEETAVDLLKKGLCDFVLKDKLQRLVPAIERSLKELQGKRKQEETEAKLEKHEQLMKAVLQGTSDAIFVKDREGRYLLFNDSAARFVGRDAAAVIGKDDTDLFDDKTARAIMACDRAIMADGSLKTYEETVVTRHGDRFVFHETKGPIFGQNGIVTGIFGVSRDITDRKKVEEALKDSEARFRTYVESSPMGIIVADKAGRFLDVNPTAEKLLGYGRAELLAMGVEHIAPPEDLNEVREDYDRMIASGYLEGEYRMHVKDRRIIWVALKGEKIDENRFMAYFQDITSRKEDEKARLFNTRLLELVHTHVDIPALIREFVKEIKGFIECDAVGIRVLDQDGNIPYQAYDGFSPGFFETESPLSIKSDKCMCINVIKGTVDASLPFYTKGGSFYINGTSRFLATVSAEDKKETRNACNAVGFESVALVPFRSEGKILGLIHVADRLENMFPLHLVELLERAVMQLGTAFQRTQARMELGESEEKLRAIIDNSGGVIWVKDLDGRFLVVNAYLLHSLNKQKEEVIGKTVFDLFPPDLARQYTENDRKVILSGNPLEVEEQSSFADGQRIFLSVRFPLRDLNGKIYAIGAISTDISRIKDAERSLKVQEEKYRSLSQEYRVLLDNVPDGIVYLSPDYRIRWTNAAANRFFGLNGTTDSRGKTCHETFWKKDGSCPDCPVVRSIQTRRNEIGELSPELDERRFEIRAVPITGESGEVQGVIEIIRDITEHRRLEEQFRQAQKMESIGTLAGGIAHDFNNILSAVLGYGEIVLDSMDEDSPLRDGMNSIIEAGLRAAHLTKDLLLFSRKQVSDKGPVELNSVISKIEKFIRRVIGEDIQCATHLLRKPLMIFADGHQIEQVLMNLATNARDAMPKGGVFSIATSLVEFDRDFVEAHGFGKPGSYALLTVSDTGNGMDRQTMEKIFEPFFTTKETGKGTGLGLAVAYGIVNDHQGYIHVYSEPDKGTTFRVYLPVIQEKGRSVKSLEESERPAGGNEVILLAEDEVSVRKLFTTILVRSGYTVIEAVDGEDAIQKFEENKDIINLLLFDLVMPKLDGKVALEAIHRIKAGVKGIFVSGYAPENIQQKDLFDLHMEVLFKPVSPKELLRTIRKILDGS